jgi:serine palmitoyltransferase
MQVPTQTLVATVPAVILLTPRKARAPHMSVGVALVMLLPSQPESLSPPPPHQSIFKKCYLTAMRSAQSYLMALSEADARSRNHDPASTMSTPALSLSSSATTLSEDDVSKDAPYDNSDGLAYPVNPRPQNNSVPVIYSLAFARMKTIDIGRHTKLGPRSKRSKSGIPLLHPHTTYLSYLICICFGHMCDFIGKRLYPAFYGHILAFDVS